MAAPPSPGYSPRVDPIDWSAIAAALVTLWFYVSAGWAGIIGVSAIRRRTFAPELGLEVRGRTAAALGWATLVLAAALLAAGALVSYVAMRD